MNVNQIVPRRMDTLQHHSNTINSLYEKVLRYYQKESTNLLHEKIFDIPASFDMKRFLITQSIEHLLCSDMECDFDLNDCRLEKINMYLSKRR